MIVKTDAEKAQMTKTEQREYLAKLKAYVRELEGMQKANRVLSAQNEQDLKDAVEQHKIGIAKAQGVLAQVGPLANTDEETDADADKELIEVEIKDLLEALDEAEGAL
ncbi:MAG: hypothetical protein WAL97_05170 [Halobacteriota archaeon]